MSHMLKLPLSSDRRLLFCDLDGTLIYSHRHPYAGASVWIEALNGCPQSFMTQYTYQYLKEQRWMRVVPLTTRNQAQFGRLRDMADHLDMQEALICNGAVLMTKQGEDPDWRTESERMAQPVLPHLTELMRSAEAIVGVENVMFSEPFMFYARSDRADAVFQELVTSADSRQIVIHRDLRKVYCIPKVFSKGNAARRYCKRVGSKRFMAAGDSDLDISMLSAAETAFCPTVLKGMININAKLCYCAGWFSDTLCDKLEEIRIEEK